MINVILVTEKETDKTTIAGQVNNRNISTVSAIAKKITGEKATNVSKRDGIVTATTKNFHVDFTGKGNLPL